MASFAFSLCRSPADRPARITGGLSPTGKTRLALVATSDTLCGVAAYTRHLSRHLSDSFDITLFDLDQYLMRSRHPRVRKLADARIRLICRELRSFPAVNLQLEHGTLGYRTKDICRRFAWLVAAAPTISVTFHTMYGWEHFDRGRAVKELLTLQLKQAIRSQAAYRRSQRLAIEIPRRLRQAQRRKPVAAIVHNRRDLRDLQSVHGIRDVYDHPLTYLGDTEADEIRGGASRRRFPVLDPVGDGELLIGVFGFLNRYKGFGTAIQALHLLPANYHLLIFGGVHPNEITAHQAIHPYVASLLSDAYIDATLPERLANAGVGAPALTLTLDKSLKDLLIAHPKDLAARLHFMGSLDEADFLAGMAICDSVVFPYVEVGQSASGPIAQALELGCRIIASRTHAFREFGRYHKDRIEFFDIGNHLELAALIQARPQFDRRGALDYTVATNAATYRLANNAEPPEARPERARPWMPWPASWSPAGSNSLPAPTPTLPRGHGGGRDPRQREGGGRHGGLNETGPKV